MLGLDINILLSRILFISPLLQSSAIVKAQKILKCFKKPSKLALKQFYYEKDLKPSGNTVKVTT